MTKLPVAVVILTLDEEANLVACLESVMDWASEVVVIDSGSRDKTVGIAEGLGARVVIHAFESHSAQWRWALQNAEIRSPWILGIDADQRVSSELAESLRREFRASNLPTDVDGYYVVRRQVFRGRWIRHGGYYPKYLLKLFRSDRVYFDAHDLMDHHFYVTGGTKRLLGDIVEDNIKERDIGFWVAKHNRYAALVAQEQLARSAEFSPWPQNPSLRGTPDQRVMWKKGYWYRLPLYLRPFLYFVYRYFLRFGFLDGKEGFIFHFMQAFWYRLLIDINIDQLRHGSLRADMPGELRPTDASLELR